MQGAVATYELIFMRASGERFPVSVSPFTVRNRNGEIVNFAATVKDITKRMQAQEELRLSATFQRDILDSLPAHIAVLDKAGKILTVNEPWLRFARNNGNPQFEKVGDGADYFEVCGPACGEGDAYATAAVAGIKEVLGGKRKRFSLEYPCDAPEEARWFSMEVLQPLGKAVGAIISHTDITARKQAEEALAGCHPETAASLRTDADGRHRVGPGFPSHPVESGGTGDFRLHPRGGPGSTCLLHRPSIVPAHGGWDLQGAARKNRR